MTGPYSGSVVAGPATTIDPGARYDGSNQTGSGYALSSVDLASGTLRAYTEASGGQQATASASFTEQVFDFRWIDPAKSGPIKIGYAVTLDGVFSNLSTDPSFGKTVFPTLSSSISVTDETNQVVLVSQSGNIDLDHVISGDPFHSTFNSIAEAPWEFVQAGHIYSLNAALTLQTFAQGDYACPGIPTCSLRNHGILDMGHTMIFNFIVPEGVTYQSGSGIFMTGIGEGVPEESSLLLLGAGLMLIPFARKIRVQDCG
jgi:hypothetical protein